LKLPEPDSRQPKRPAQEVKVESSTILTALGRKSSARPIPGCLRIDDAPEKPASLQVNIAREDAAIDATVLWHSLRIQYEFLMNAEWRNGTTVGRASRVVNLIASTIDQDVDS
jgi:hypothetical protein